jgi:hypothetical protein
VVISTPELSEMLANAKANVARVSDAAKLAYLRKLDDTSDERYFVALMESAFRQDPHWRGYAFETSLGSQWRCRIIESRMNRLLPLMTDMYQVASYSESDCKRIFRLAGMPQRYKYNFVRCIQFARTAVDIVSDPEFGSLHAFFERLVRVDGGWQQPVLHATLLGTFKGLGRGAAEAFVVNVGLCRGANPHGVLILQRLGVVSGGAAVRLPSDAECHEAAVFYQRVSAGTGRPFRFVEAVFSSNFAWSRFEAIRWPSRKAVCFGDGPACNICTHAIYCAKNGIVDLIDSELGWLSLYPDFRAWLVGGCSTLGRMPGVAIEAVLSAFRHENYIFWQRPVSVPREEQLLSVGASLAYVPVDALREAYERRASGYFLEARTLEDWMPETWSVGELVERQVPCLLDIPPSPLYAGEGDALLAEYIRRGHATVPLLAVNWQDVADAVEE